MKVVHNFILDFGEADFFYDEPKAYHYFATIKHPLGVEKSVKTSNAGGISFFDRKEAQVKCIVEALERYSMYSHSRETGRRDVSFNYLSDRNIRALDPQEFKRFSEKQLFLPNFRRFRFDSDTNLDWMEGFDLLTGEKKLVPTQLAYLHHPRYHDEPIIEFPVSTGAAGGFDLDGPIYRGICEIIERDTFMIHYLNKLSPVMINLSKINDAKLKNLIEYLRSYNLDLYIFDITGDIPLYTFLCIVVDKNKLGLPLALGMKTSLDPFTSLLGSLQEAFHVRTWSRKIALNIIDKSVKFTHKPTTLTERAKFWSKRKYLRTLDFLLKTRKIKSLSSYKKVDVGDNEKNLKSVSEILRKLNIKTYWVDITAKEIGDTGVKVVKVLMPSLMPVYFNENYPYLGVERLYSMPVNLNYFTKPLKEENLNRIPHPLL